MSGICDLIPGSVIDATMFNPCGYSMNGMKADVSSRHFKQLFWGCWSFLWGDFCFLPVFLSSPPPQGTYWTIHITPEPEFSYVSFETNLSQTTYDDLIRRVVEVFRPGKLVTTLFVNQVCVLFFFLFERCRWLCMWFITDVCLHRAPNVAASFLLPRSLRATSVLTASWHSSTITILSSQVTPSRTSKAEAVGWRGENRKGAAWQAHPAHHSASTSPPGVATIAQAAPVVWWPPALLYPPA